MINNPLQLQSKRLETFLILRTIPILRVTTDSPLSFLWVVFTWVNKQNIPPARIYLSGFKFSRLEGKKRQKLIGIMLKSNNFTSRWYPKMHSIVFRHGASQGRWIIKIYLLFAHNNWFEFISRESQRGLHVNRELKRGSFWATHINHKWTFWILRQWFRPIFSGKSSLLA